jgi:hypothetical protein
VTSGAGADPLSFDLGRQADPGAALPYGARSDDAVIVGDLLMRHVPELASGELEIVAIARAPGQSSKVAIRRRLRVQPKSGRPVPLVLGQSGERILAVRAALGPGERVHVVQWHAEPQRYIAAAIGLSYVPTTMLYLRSAIMRISCSATLTIRRPVADARSICYSRRS